MCIDIYKLYIYIDFTKTGNVEQELPLQNIFLYVSGFSGETGRPRFFHIIPLQNGSLYFRWFSFFQVAILLKCLLMSGSPLCRGQWFWKSQKCTKKRGWVPWFCRENPLLDLWQVPHSVEAWGAKSQIWLYKMGTSNPPQVIFWDNLFGTKIAGIFFWILHKRWSHVGLSSFVPFNGPFFSAISMGLEICVDTLLPWEPSFYAGSWKTPLSSCATLWMNALFSENLAQVGHPVDLQRIADDWRQPVVLIKLRLCCLKVWGKSYDTKNGGFLHTKKPAVLDYFSRHFGSCFGSEKLVSDWCPQNLRADDDFPNFPSRLGGDHVVGGSSPIISHCMAIRWWLDRPCVMKSFLLLCGELATDPRLYVWFC